MNRSSFLSKLGPALGLALGAVLGTACGDTTNPAAEPLNLDRPVDIAFACYGRMRVTNGNPASAADDVIMTVQPTTSCDTRSLPTATLEARPPGQEDLPDQVVGTADWYGFILESADGTVALAHWASQSADKFMGSVGAEVQVLDADPLTPGKNGISIGEEPIGIATDKSGCYEVTANAGSCDLSMLDINSALAGLTVLSSLGPVNPGQAGAARVDRVPVKNQMGGTILAKPAAMVAEPSTSTDVVGNACKTVSDPTSPSGTLLAPSGVAYIAYPSCHLVAAIDMSKGGGGTVVAAITYEAAGPRLLSPAEVPIVSCPAECGAAPQPVTAGIRPVTLAYRLDPRADAVHPRRLAIGADNSASVTLVELGPDSLPLSLSQIPLQDPTGKLGITAIALSPQLGMGGNLGDTNETQSAAGQGAYVYAVATDRTVRVADVLNIGKECDTQVDMRFLQDSSFDSTQFNSLSVQALQCFPVGDVHTPPRRSGARGPGIELPGNGVPISVAFIKAPPLQDLTMPGKDIRVASPTTLLGTFAVITATDGQAFVVNVDDDDNPAADTFDGSQPQLTAPVLVMAHQLRDTVASRDVGAESSPMIPSCLVLGVAGSSGPRATTPPLTFTVGGPIATSKVFELPTIRQVECDTGPNMGDAPLNAQGGGGTPVSELMLAASSTVRNEVFPDLRSLFSEETWSLTWEGALSQDTSITAIDGPAIREAQMFVDSTASSRMDDKTHPFCAMGVEPFDILQIRGCNPVNQDQDCPSNYTCFVHPDRSVSIGGATIGSCMLVDEVARLENTCRDFLISLRRYTISQADSGEVVLRPRQHVLRTSPLDGCTSDLQCNVLADYAAQNATDAVTRNLQTPPTNQEWQCLADDTRAPINPDPALNKRCVQRCVFHSKDTDGMDRDTGCDPGTICQGATVGDDATHPSGFCMEGVMPPQACVNAPQRFEVRASEAFTVIGSHSGYIHPLIENPDKTDPLKAQSCVVDKAATRVQIGRIPLTAPACDPLADPINGELPSGGFEANPCSLTTPQFESSTTYPDGSCTGPTIGFDRMHPRTAPAIKFRNPGLTLTIVDPYYTGDQTCPLDRKGSLDPTIASGRIPLVFPSYQISFTQTSGYSPLTESVVSSTFAPAFPVKVVAGPTNSIWILDDGDFLSTTLGFPSTRGQVFRIESLNLGVINLLQ